LRIETREILKNSVKQNEIAQKLSDARRREGLYLFLLGSAFFVLFGVALESSAPSSLVDFRMMYYPARCLLEHGDPYDASAVSAVYNKTENAGSLEPERTRQIVTRFVYPPTAFSFTTLFAALPLPAAKILWLMTTLGSLILASYLIWDFSASYAPIVSGALIGFLLANSEVLAITGTAAGIVVAFCVVSVWCITQEKFVPIGILFLAISLLVKPQDSGFIWLYFLLAGGAYRTRALQSLALTALLGLPAVIWIWHVAPHWLTQLHSNLEFFFAKGGINAPGLDSSGAHGLAKNISLQAVFAVFRDDPGFFNPASYLICAPLLLLWGWAASRMPRSVANTWFALAAISLLSLLPIYHRTYDAKLVLLAVPACAMVWSEGWRIGRLILIFTASAFVLVGDFSNAILLALVGNMHSQIPTFSFGFKIATEVFLAPLTLLFVGMLYLWLTVKSFRNSIGGAKDKLDIAHGGAMAGCGR
jgi:hypothetical protein